MIKTVKNAQKNTPSNLPEAHYYDMIVFCHLRWHFVYQRPQHIISRLKTTMKILFIEEPLYNDANSQAGNFFMVDEMLHVLQPNVKDIESIAGIIPQYVSNKNIPVGWFYSPSFSPVLEQINFEIVVYDCMDELSLFKGAPAQLIDQEKYLMAQADIIFYWRKIIIRIQKSVPY